MVGYVGVFAFSFFAVHMCTWCQPKKWNISSQGVVVSWFLWKIIFLFLTPFLYRWVVTQSVIGEMSGQPPRHVSHSKMWIYQTNPWFERNVYFYAEQKYSKLISICRFTAKPQFPIGMLGSYFFIFSLNLFWTLLSSLYIGQICLNSLLICCGPVFLKYFLCLSVPFFNILKNPIFFRFASVLDEHCPL